MAGRLAAAGEQMGPARPGSLPEVDKLGIADPLCHPYFILAATERKRILGLVRVDSPRVHIFDPYGICFYYAHDGIHHIDPSLPGYPSGAIISFTKKTMASYSLCIPLLYVCSLPDVFLSEHTAPGPCAVANGR